MTIRRIPMLLVLVVLVTGIPAAVEFYTDWLWFKEVGYEQVFVRSLTAQTLATVISGLVVFGLLAGNLLLALRSLRPRPFMVATPQGPQTIMMDPSSIRPLAIGVVGVVALLTALYGFFGTFVTGVVVSAVLAIWVRARPSTSHARST